MLIAQIRSAPVTVDYAQSHALYRSYRYEISAIQIYRPYDP